MKTYRIVNLGRKFGGWKICSTDIALGDTYYRNSYSTGMVELILVKLVQARADSNEDIIPGIRSEELARYKEHKGKWITDDARRKNAFKVVADLPEGIDANELVGKNLTEDDVQLIINPYPPIVKQLMAIMEKYGEKWQDDTKENHLDDFRPLDAAKAIHEALLTQQLDLVTNQLIPYERKESETREANIAC